MPCLHQESDELTIDELLKGRSQSLGAGHAMPYESVCVFQNKIIHVS